MEIVKKEKAQLQIDMENLEMQITEMAYQIRDQDIEAIHLEEENEQLYDEREKFENDIQNYQVLNEHKLLQYNQQMEELIKEIDVKDSEIETLNQDLEKKNQEIQTLQNQIQLMNVRMRKKRDREEFERGHNLDLKTT